MIVLPGSEEEGVPWSQSSTIVVLRLSSNSSIYRFNSFNLWEIEVIDWLPIESLDVAGVEVVKSVVAGEVERVLHGCIGGILRS